MPRGFNYPSKIALSIIALLLLALVVLPKAAEESTTLPAFLQGRENGAWVSSKGTLVRPKAARAGRIVWRPLIGDPVDVKSREGDWAKVSRDDGKVGWVECRRLSTAWILVQKKKRTLSLMEGAAEEKKWPIDLGADPVGDKEMSGTLAPGHYRTPEGEMSVCRLVPWSKFHKAYLLSYPTIRHAKLGLKKRLITQAQYNRIVRAAKLKRCPPQRTKLGGFLEIHGYGTGGQYDWTLGCIALRNEVMDKLKKKKKVGTPVVITP